MLRGRHSTIADTLPVQRYLTGIVYETVDDKPKPHYVGVCYTITKNFSIRITSIVELGEATTRRFTRKPWADLWSQARDLIVEALYS